MNTLNPTGKRQKIIMSKRLYDIQHKIIAITGGIATGKSTIGQLIKDQGYAFISADEQIKEIYKQKSILELIKEESPEIIEANNIDFKKLRRLYFDNPEFAKKLNSIIYPTLEKRVFDFANTHSKDTPIFYEIPLLFEKKLQDQVDDIILVYASEDIQRQRIQSRDQSSKETIDAVLNRQISIDKKKAFCRHIIMNDQLELDMSSLKEQLDSVLKQLLDNH